MRKQVNLRLDNEVYKSLDDNAKSKGMTLPEYIRMLLSNYI